MRAGTVSKFDAAEPNLTRDSRAAGLGDPPPEVLFDLVWRTRLDSALSHADTYRERALIAARIFDERYGGNEEAKVKAYARTEGDAKAYYEELRPQLYPAYADWSGQVQYVLDAQLEAQPAR